MRHAKVLFCITPKSPDEPCTRQANLGSRNWSVVYDPDGTFSDGNRLGQQDIYYGLINWSFTPGTVLMQYYDTSGKSVNRKWTVKLRIEPHKDVIMDAYCYLLKGCNAKNGKTGLRVAWLRQQSSRIDTDSEQMKMEVMA